ncbi:unnamed protein product [Ceratitis capitata]|uniref:(Mediterranean fruit fly) hypothetical protein n=1 Tax=Ceratitis capitata TaxID=7213 RepID=A0A811UZS1_CERCA|nr:unnamed protein product [Ceratitis capitata]
MMDIKIVSRSGVCEEDVFYQLIDGTRRTEIGFLPIAANSGAYMQDERATAERLAIRMRARANSKNRKLSPKSLQSLAG